MRDDDDIEDRDDETPDLADLFPGFASRYVDTKAGRLFLRTGEGGRDGCRVPIPWSGATPPYGFGPGSGQPWIPQPAGWETVTVEAEDADPESMLAFYRAALRTRRTFATSAGDAVEVLDPSEVGADVLAFRRGPITVVVNCGDEPIALPAGEVLLASGPVSDVLPPDTAVWLS